MAYIRYINTSYIAGTSEYILYIRAIDYIFYELNGVLK